MRGHGIGFEWRSKKNIHRSQCLEWLGYGAESRGKVVSLRLGFAMRQLENFLCQPSSKWVPFLACLEEVQEELLYYPRHWLWRQRWRWRRRR